jgi:DNA-binding PadR family transcriptional regulator
LTTRSTIDIPILDIVRRSAVADTDRSLDAGVLVMMSLANGPKHGYAIIQDIAAFADTRMGPGTLYAAIERLETGGLIAPVASSDRRKPYRLTPTGLTALRTRTEELKRLTSVATRRLATR